MASLSPRIEPYDAGMLSVGGGHRVYWETCGDPNGRPAVVVHGGPGSGCTGWHRRLFDPATTRIVLFDQRNCGRSRPHASEPDVDLSTNTTQHLIADMEALREHLEVERWLVFGGSWGSTLSLAYAEAHPDRVSEMVLWGITTGRRAEADWLFRGGVAPLFPEQWERLCAGVPASDRDGDIVEAYARMLHDPDPAVHRRAALHWCTWESATPDWPPTAGLDSRYTDPDFALAFARLVTHYIRHDEFLEDGVLLRDAGVLADIPGTLVNGRFDLQAPIGNAWALHRVWPRAELVIVDDAGHAADEPALTDALIRALDC
ncbi:MAG: prolyl aminopeptidase [Actinomycetota bacterium]